MSTKTGNEKVDSLFQKYNVSIENSKNRPTSVAQAKAAQSKGLAKTSAQREILKTGESKVDSLLAKYNVSITGSRNRPTSAEEARAGGYVTHGTSKTAAAAEAPAANVAAKAVQPAAMQAQEPAQTAKATSTSRSGLIDALAALTQGTSKAAQNQKGAAQAQKDTSSVSGTYSSGAESVPAAKTTGKKFSKPALNIYTNEDNPTGTGQYLKEGGTETAVEMAQRKLESAQAEYEAAANSGAFYGDDDAFTRAYGRYTKAMENLDQAKAALKAAKAQDTGTQNGAQSSTRAKVEQVESNGQHYRDQAAQRQQEQNRAQAAYDEAKAAYDKALSENKAARARYSKTSSRSDYEALNQSDAAVIGAAQEVEKAEAALAEAKESTAAAKKIASDPKGHTVAMNAQAEKAKASKGTAAKLDQQVNQAVGAYTSAQSELEALQNEYQETYAKWDSTQDYQYWERLLDLDEEMAQAQKNLDAATEQAEAAMLAQRNQFTGMRGTGTTQTEEIPAYRQTAETFDEYQRNKQLTGLIDKGWAKAEEANSAREQEEQEAYDVLNSWTYNGVSPIAKSMLTLTVDESYKRPTDEWTQAEKDYYSLLYLNDKESAEEYAVDVNNSHNAQSKAEQAQSVQDWVSQNALTRIAGGAGGLAANIAGLGAADVLTSAMEYAARGQITQRADISPYEAGNTAIAKNAEDLNAYGTINENVPIVGGKGFGDLYQATNSVLESMATVGLYGPYGTDMVFFANSAASELEDARNSGATDGQALGMALVAGAAEAAGEHISASHLLEMMQNPIVDKFFSSLAGQNFEEAEEEVFTDVVTNVAQNLILKSNSEFYQKVDEYKQLHPLASEEAAKDYAWSEILEETAYDGLSGYYSGAMHTTIIGGAQAAQDAIATRQYGKMGPQILTTGLSLGDGSYANVLASQMAVKQESGGKITNREYQQLYGAELINEAINMAAAGTETAAAADTQENSPKALAEQLLNKAQSGGKIRNSEIMVLWDGIEQVKNQNTEYLYGDSARELVEEGLSTSEGTAAHKLAAQAKGILDKGGKLTGTQLREIIAANDEQFQYEDTEAEEEPEEGPEAEAQALAAETGAEQAAEETAQEQNADASATLENPDQKATTAEQSTDVETAQEQETIQPVQTETPSIAQTQTNEQAQSAANSSLESLSQKYGQYAEQMRQAYAPGQDAVEYDAAFNLAYEMGKANPTRASADTATMNNVGALQVLSDTQRQIAYGIGQAAGRAEAANRDAQVQSLANGNTGHTAGTVRGDNVSLTDLKTTFNDQQNIAYSTLSTIAEATGINIVLYRSQADSSGNYIGAQGRYDRSDPGTIYIDVNAGLKGIRNVGDLGKYAMLRTFTHEFVHFCESWSASAYNDLRGAVFTKLEEQGEDVNGLIEAVQAKNEGMSYDKASREVVAESLTDILPDSGFVQDLAEEHKNIFEKLADKLHEFLDNLRAYFSKLGYNQYRGAQALKEQVGEELKYVEDIVKLFDRVAKESVGSYQRTIATAENAQSESQEATVENVTDVQAVQAAEESTEESPKNLQENSEESPTETVQEVKNTAEGAQSESAPQGNANVTEEKPVQKKEPAAGQKEETINGSESENGTDTGAVQQPVLREPETPRLLDGVGQEAVQRGSEERDPVRTGVENGGAVPGGDAGSDAAGAQSERGPRDSVGGDLQQLPGVEENAAQEEPAEKPSKAQEEPKKPSQIEEKPKKPPQAKKESGESKPIAQRIKETLATQDSIDIAGTRARILDNGGAYTAQIYDIEKDGHTGNLLATDMFGTREEAIEYIVEGIDGLKKLEEQLGGKQKAKPSKKASETAQEQQEREEAEHEANVKAHEDVQQEIERVSEANPKGSNFTIGNSLNLPSGEKARIRANIEAIRVVKQLISENRYATKAEQEILSKYVGWGGLPKAFGETFTNYTTHRVDTRAVQGLEKEFNDLKELLTDEEYQSARKSTENAHYTSIEVIKAMYDGLKGLGFTGGRLLEPSCGTGNFVGAMPADMTAGVKSWTIVELDGITGAIAKYLYPNADTRIQGFEKVSLPNNYMDVAIGNVPFGNYGIADKSYPKTVTGEIHNYFFAKALDKVRPGGLVMFITSSYTLDSHNNRVRDYIAQRADLLGAIRLPNTAFKGNAGTEVVTDILVLKKRAERTQYAGEAFLQAEWQTLPGSYYSGSYFNEYFKAHPEMILGTAAQGKMYRSNDVTYNPLEGRGTLGEQIREAFKNIKVKMDYPTQPTAEQSNFRQENAKRKKRSLVVQGGKLLQRDENGNTSEVQANEDTQRRIVGMVGIRDAYTKLCDAMQQGLKASEIKKFRKRLNDAYDSFVSKYGYLNDSKNKRAIRQFSDQYSLLSLEKVKTGKDGKVVSISKADIFTKNTVAANRTVATAENVEEGMTVSMNVHGRVDTAYIAQLTGEKEADVTRQLIDQRLAFKDKDGNLIPAVQYLSGNVRAKLKEMEGLVSIDPDYRNNVEALKNVVPATIHAEDIFVQPGANWIPASMYEQFVGYMLGTYNGYSRKKRYSVEYFPGTNQFKVTLDSSTKSSMENRQKWAAGGLSFENIMERMLNSKDTNAVTRKDEDGRAVVDKKATQEVAQMIENIRKEFTKWIWSDAARTQELEELYNDKFNGTATPKYDGSALTINGMNSEWHPKEHQANAIARILSSGGNTLLAHRVGAGKTFEMAAAAMKMKQLGIIKKPMFVVPNNVVAQWGIEFKTAFPAANILVVGDTDMSPDQRMTTLSNIKNNDYDAVILAYTKFEAIPMEAQWQRKFYQEQVDEVLYALSVEHDASGKKSFTIKQMEKLRDQLLAKIEKLESKKDEAGATFGELGVDALFVDEAHNFKNLTYASSINNVKGLGKKDGSQRSFDLYTKVRYLQQLNGGRGVVFATATPIMNSMSEMYTMMRYLANDKLKQMGIEHFDAWAKQFGIVQNELEVTPSGTGYKIIKAFDKFKNVKGLQQLFLSFSDVLTDIPDLVIPKMKGGKTQVVECPASEVQRRYMDFLDSRRDVLQANTDARKAAYSQRMIDSSLPYEEDGKIYRCCDNVWKVYQESNATKGTQMIFSDFIDPHTVSNSEEEIENKFRGEFAPQDRESIHIYEDIKARLIELGIPANEIAMIHEAKNAEQKKRMSERMNSGEIRVMIGSTGKMGVGLNAQKKAIAIHHLDVPYRPGDIEQRDGRVFRQGNENKEAYRFVYVTKGSYDAAMWDKVERKQKFIQQVMRGDDVGNEVEDIGSTSLSASEMAMIKGIASGNPLMMEQFKLQKDIDKFQTLKAAHQRNVNTAKVQAAKDYALIKALEGSVKKQKLDLAARKDTYSEGKFSITIGSSTYTDRKEAGEALVAEAVAKAQMEEWVTIGEFAGFPMKVMKTGEDIHGVLKGEENHNFKIYPGNPSYGMTALRDLAKHMEITLKITEEKIQNLKADMKGQEELAEQPFEFADQLIKAQSRYAEIMAELNPGGATIVVDDGVQEESRDFLEDEDEAQLDREYLAAVERGDMETAQRMVDEKANQCLNTMLLPDDSDEAGFKYHRGPTPTKTFRRYAVFNVSADGFRAAYAGNKNATPVGPWLDAQNLKSYVSDMTQFRDGTFASYIPGDTGSPWKKHFTPELMAQYEKEGLKKSAGLLLERGGKHSSDVPNFRQMNLYRDENGNRVSNNMKDGSLPHNKLMFEIEYGITDGGDLTDYVREHGRIDQRGANQGLAKIQPNQYYDFKTNPNAVGNWGLGGTFRILRLVPHSEIVEKTAEYKQNAIDEANELYRLGEISKDDRKARIKNTNDITLQKWVGGYHPEDFGLSEEIVKRMSENGRKMKLTDPVTYDDNGNVIPLSERFNPNKEDIRYQPRVEPLTDRDILLTAAQDITDTALTDGERDALDIFKSRLDKLGTLQEKRQALGTLYKEQQFGKHVDREAAKKTLEEMRRYDDLIQKANEKVISAETSPALRKVLPRARAVIEQAQKAKDDATLARWRDRRDNAAKIKKYREQIEKDVADIAAWATNPSNKNDMKHLPDVFKSSVIPFLTRIDFTSKRALRGGEATKRDAAFGEQLKKLQAALKRAATADELYSGYTDLPPEFMDRLQTCIDAVERTAEYGGDGNFTINRMTSSEMRALSLVVKNLKSLIRNTNSFLANAIYQHVYDAGDATISELNRLNDAKGTGATGEAINKFVFWTQIRPAYAFERMGNGGKAIFDGLRRGQSTLAFDAKQIIAFAEKAYTAEEAKQWEQEIKPVTIGGETVRMKVTQIMSLYELMKRQQAQTHLYGEGIRASSFREKGKKVADSGHRLGLAEAQEIVSVLSPRQIEVADALQKYMQEVGGSWGNEVSVKRFGEKQFGEPNYFPINSDGRHLEADAGESPSNASLYALLNMGFTKKTQENAKKRVVLYSIFDVFSNHMASMAQYHAMALPVLDTLKWFNYRVNEERPVRTETGEITMQVVKDSVRDELARVFGVPDESRPGSGSKGYAESFVMNIVRAFNGTETQGTASDNVGLNALRTYNIAQVAYNLRVVLQQPLAITRAGMIVDYKSIVQGLKMSPKAIKENVDEMQRYSGIAAWKGLGFYDTNISRGLTSMIKHDDTAMDKINEAGMWGAEKADTVTWAAMWNACKAEVRRKTGFAPGSDAFYEAVTSKFEEVVYKTQVVDGVLTKNEFLRSKGFFARATGSFMSEPTTTFSMLADAYDKYRMDMQRGMTKQEAWKANRKNIGRTAYVYGLGAVILAAATAVADAWRDDDKYKTFGTKYWESFASNVIDELLPFNKLPLVSTVYDLSKELLSKFGVDTYGYSPNSVWMQWYDSLAKGTEILYDKISSDDTNYTWYGGAYKLLQAASGMTGLPIAAATREAVGIWNNTVGQFAPSLMVRSYEQKPETEIKYTYLDGSMSGQRAADMLIRDAGYNREEADEKITIWQFMRDNRGYASESEASVSNYLDYAQPAHVDPETFFSMWEFNNDATADKDEAGKSIAGSKKAKVMKYIDGLELTAAQKDALYYAAGYKESTIDEAPWH